MSCIIAYKSKNQIYLISDTTRNFRGLNKVNIVNESKVIKLNDNTAIGVIGDSFIGQLVREKFTIDKIENISLSDLTIFLKELVKPHIQKEHINEYLIAYNGKIYYIFNDFSITEIENFYAIGCGSEVALGYMEAFNDIKNNPGILLNAAMKAVCKYTMAVSEPFNLITVNNS